MRLLANHFSSALREWDRIAPRCVPPINMAELSRALHRRRVSMRTLAKRLKIKPRVFAKQIRGQADIWGGWEDEIERTLDLPYCSLMVIPRSAGTRLDSPTPPR